MTLIEKALRLATAAHVGQTRKGSTTPYIVHPTMVALMLAKYGFEDEVLAAALAHDVLEDTTVTEEQLRAELGDAVTGLVLGVTEDKTLPWEERKRRYISMIGGGPEKAKAISAADKINNLTGLLDMHEQLGEEVWEIFNSSRDKKLWFEESMLGMLRETWQHPLVDEYEGLVRELRALA